MDIQWYSWPCVLKQVLSWFIITYYILYYLLHTDVPICNVNSFDVYSLLDKHLLILQQRLRMGRQLHGQCGGQLSLVCHHERAPKACHLEMFFNPWSWTSNAWDKHPQSLHEMGFSKWIWHQNLRCSVLDVKTWELEPARWLMVMNELVDKRKWYHDPSLSLHFDQLAKVRLPGILSNSSAFGATNWLYNDH